MKQLISIMIIAFLCASCEKVVDLKYKDNPSRLVISGNITNEAGPYYVKISKSIKLTETGAYPLVNDAVVTISDDAGNSETLTSQGNGTYRATTLTGVPGRTYTLTVQAEGQTYTAQSTMQPPVPFDSIKVEKLLSTGEIEYNFIPVYLDPVAKGNNYRFVLTVNNKLINQHFVQNDDVKNGVVNTVRLEVNTDDLEFKEGDQIDLTMECVDAKVYLYYKTLALMGDSGPGGGTTPNNPQSNISNNALGLFSAHTVEKRSVVLR